MWKLFYDVIFSGSESTTETGVDCELRRSSLAGSPGSPAILMRISGMAQSLDSIDFSNSSVVLFKV